MNPKQRTFVSEYLKDFNATQAAIRAGYSEKTAYSIGQENLKKPEISEAINVRIEENTMSANEVLREIADIARLDIGDFLEFKDGVKAPYLDLRKAKDAGLLKLVKKIKYNAQGFIEFELYDKQAALVQIGKWQGLTEKVQNLNIDLSTLTTDQLDRLAKGEDVYSILATPGAS